ncbi:MAG: prepilin-type N-terminal cleavage/methylation domain-containing protein [Geobacteraceae bacterium]
MKQVTVNQNGFTLIEVLVAITLLLIGIFSVISMQITAIKSNSIANKLSAATALAQETMDDVMAWSISDPRLNTSTADAVYDLNGVNSAGTDLTVPAAGVFRSTYTTTINTPVAGVTRIVVSIFRVTNGVCETTPYVSLTSCKRTT